MNDNTAYETISEMIYEDGTCLVRRDYGVISEELREFEVFNVSAEGDVIYIRSMEDDYITIKDSRMIKVTKAVTEDTTTYSISQIDDDSISISFYFYKEV